MVLEVRQITGFLLILKTEHNLSPLIGSIQSLKKLRVNVRTIVISYIHQ